MTNSPSESVPSLEEITYLHSDGVPLKEFRDGFLFTSARGRFFLDFLDHKKILYNIYRSRNKELDERFKCTKSYLRLVFFQPFFHDLNHNFASDVAAFANIEYETKYNISAGFSLSSEDFLEFTTNYQELLDWYLWNPFQVK